MNDKIAQRLEQYARDADSVKSHKIAKDLREAASALRSRGEAFAYMQDCSLAGVTLLKSRGEPAVFTCRTVKDDLHTFPLYNHPATPASAWRPIAEAPRDGREMILLLTPSRIPQVAYSNTWWTAGFSVECKPTHWMPLPTPPTSTKGG